MINVVSSSTPAMLLDGLLALEGNLDACHIDDGSDHIRVDRKLERILRRACLRDESLALQLKDASSYDWPFGYRTHQSKHAVFSCPPTSLVELRCNPLCAIRIVPVARYL